MQASQTASRSSPALLKTHNRRYIRSNSRLKKQRDVLAKLCNRLKGRRECFSEQPLMTREKSLGAAEVAKRHESAAPPCGAFTACMTTFYLLGSPNPTNKGPSSESYVKTRPQSIWGAKNVVLPAAQRGGVPLAIPGKLRRSSNTTRKTV